jgi:uncharacterized protein YcnI
MKRVITILGLASVAALATASSAFAHVTANPADQQAGGFTKLEFRVPNERDVPSTTIDIQIPDGVDFVSVQPVPGWSFEVKRSKLDEPIVAEDGDEVTDRVSEVVFTGGTINAGEFQSFYIGMKLPANGEVGDYLFFPTLQTYEGGEEVSWIEKPAEGKDPFSLEKPAPFVTLGSADEGDDKAAASDSGDDAKGDDDKNEDGDESSVSDVEDTAKTALGFGIAALVLAAIGLVTGLRTRTRTERD